MVQVVEMKRPAPTRYVVVALFDPVPAGTAIERRRWPAHVTLLGNFSTAADAAEVVARAGDAVGGVARFHVELGPADRFGARHDVPVLLVRSSDAMRLHERLADQMASLPDHAQDQPAHMRTGYRPHLTLGPGVAASEGERRLVASIVLAELRGPHAVVVASFHLAR